MTEYIDKIKLIEAIRTYRHNDEKDKIGTLMLIEMQPTADVAPVKHGKWIGYQTNSFKNSSEGLKRKFYRCSICRTANAIRVNYCPYCGADMRGNRDE